MWQIFVMMKTRRYLVLNRHFRVFYVYFAVKFGNFLRFQVLVLTERI